MTKRHKLDAKALRVLADWFDVHDGKNGILGANEVQTSLRSIAARIESSAAAITRKDKAIQKWTHSWRQAKAELKEANKRIAELEKQAEYLKLR